MFNSMLRTVMIIDLFSNHFERFLCLFNFLLLIGLVKIYIRERAGNNAWECGAREL